MVALSNELYRYRTVSPVGWVKITACAGSTSPVYGTMGQENGQSNCPGARRDASIVYDPTTNALYLSGGFGLDSAGIVGTLNDVWRFSLSNVAWAWISGSKFVGADDVSVNKGMADTNNVPGCRRNHGSFVSGQYLYIYGGQRVTAGGSKS